MLPIIFMVYNRPDKARDIMEALLKCKGIEDCTVYAFSDGPKDEKARVKVNEVREVLHSYSGKMSIEVIERKENLGCSRNVAESVSQVLKENEYAIYLEDDIVPYPDFIVYMKKMAEKYKDNEKVFSINSYNQLSRSGQKGVYPSRRFSSWGAVYFSRCWKNVEFKFQPDNLMIGYDKEYLKKIDKKLVKSVTPDIYLSYLEHRNGYTTWDNHGDMWDVQCLYYMLLNNMIAITPYKDYSFNTGNDDNSGIHERRTGVKKIAVELARYIMLYTHTTGIFQKIYKNR